MTAISVPGTPSDSRVKLASELASTPKPGIRQAIHSSQSCRAGLETWRPARRWISASGGRTCSLLAGTRPGWGWPARQCGPRPGRLPRPPRRSHVVVRVGSTSDTPTGTVRGHPSQTAALTRTRRRARRCSGPAAAAPRGVSRIGHDSVMARSRRLKGPGRARRGGPEGRSGRGQAP